LNDSNGMIRFKKKLQALKKVIREWVSNYKKDQSKSILAIKSKLSNIDLILDQGGVSDELSSDQVAVLEYPISRDEIRGAVWGCGSDKSPGPDGFTFEFFRKFWTVIGPDFCVAVEWFFEHEGFATGCNSSFVALIPKCLDPKIVSDYRPTSLIGMSINIHKSHILGVGIPDNTVSEAASLLGCAILKTPFKYLGIMVGGNMSLTKAWDDTICKLKKRLSKWKLKTLSIGGRLTLLKSVLGSTPIYNMSIFKNDVWIGESPLKVVFPRLFALEDSKDASVADKFSNLLLILFVAGLMSWASCVGPHV
nr:RNA-directed DNA polymerase, eukaryota, reverse transcriptase zinc-binding domain protein [Tanacetum cinerariifolium]